MKHTSPTLAFVALVALFATAAFAANTTVPAHGPGYGYGYGPGHGYGQGYGPAMDAIIPPDKQAAFATLLAAHHAEMAPLHDTLWAKQVELRALSANPNTKPETIQAMIKELTDLRAQARVKTDAFRAKVQQELGVTLPYGMGHGRGMGYGHGMRWGGGF